MPVTPQNMSWVSVVCTGLVSFVIILWFTTKRGVFKGPRVNKALLEERRLEALHGGADVYDAETTNGLSVSPNGKDIAVENEFVKS